MTFNASRPASVARAAWAVGKWSVASSAPRMVPASARGVRAWPSRDPRAPLSAVTHRFFSTDGVSPVGASGSRPSPALK